MTEVRNWGLAVVVFAASCGDGGGSGSESEPHVPDSAQLRELDPEASRSLCIETNKEAEKIDADMVSGTCSVDGLLGEKQGNGTCADLRSQCISRGGGTPPAPYEDCEGDQENLDCTNTVGEYRACLKALVAQAHAFFGTLSCSSNLGEIADREEPSTPQECVSLGAGCPQALSDM